MKLSFRPLAGLALAAAMVWLPYDLRRTAAALPAIHDITTDLADPPAFVRVATLRRPDDNPVAYDGPEVGAQQKKAYPELAPLVLEAPPDAVFAAAQGVLASMGLAPVEADAAAGRIEATATTTGKTGVEMEAMTAVSVAALTVYDMLKGLEKGIRVSDIRLVYKAGGKSGEWRGE